LIQEGFSYSTDPEKTLSHVIVDVEKRFRSEAKISLT
jgi:hypothetical protein